MKETTLNRFSKDFSDVLFDKFPEFRNYFKIKKYDETKNGYLKVNIPHESSKLPKLSITTVDDEITIDFAWYHIHFSCSENIDELYNDSIDFIYNLINEGIAIFDAESQGEEHSFGYIKTDEIGKIENRIINEGLYYVRLKSWNGTYDSLLINKSLKYKLI